MSGNPRMLVVFTLATAVVIGGIVSLATDEWWWLLLAVALHAVATVLVLGVLGKALAQQDKPDPVEEAALDERDDDPSSPSESGGGRKMAI